MKYKFIYLLIIFSVIISACGTTKYESASVEIDQSYQTAGSVRFSVDLMKVNGRIKRLKPNKNKRKWSNIQFSGENVHGVEFGNLKYGMANLTKDNHSIKVRMVSSKYGINKEFLVKVPYVVGINVRTKSIELNKPIELEYDLVLNTGAVIPRDPRHFPYELFENHSETMVQFKDGKIQVDSYVPLVNKRLDVCFLHKITKDTLWKTNLGIEYPNEVNLRYAGESGVSGLQGLTATNPSQSGANGTNGSNGLNGQDLVLVLQYYKVESSEFIIATESVYGRHHRIFIPKINGRIFVDVHGGKGGDGGDGGSGKDAAFPVTTTVNGKTTTTKPSVYGGDAGNGGDAGSGGNGGNVYLFIEDRLAGFYEMVQMDVKAGKAGYPGRPGNAGRGINAKGQLGGWFNSNNGRAGVSGREARKGVDGKIEGPVFMNQEALLTRFSYLNKVD